MLLFCAIMLPILGSILIPLLPAKYLRLMEMVVMLVVLLTSVFYPAARPP